jgi:hypothetical protein
MLCERLRAPPSLISGKFTMRRPPFSDTWWISAFLRQIFEIYAFEMYALAAISIMEVTLCAAKWSPY